MRYLSGIVVLLSFMGLNAPQSPAQGAPLLFRVNNREMVKSLPLIGAATTTADHPYFPSATNDSSDEKQIVARKPLGSCGESDAHFTWGSTAFWSCTTDAYGKLLSVSLNTPIARRTILDMQERFSPMVHRGFNTSVAVGGLTLVGSYLWWQQHRDIYGLLGGAAGTAITGSTLVRYILVNRDKAFSEAAAKWEQEHCISAASIKKINKQMEAVNDPRIDFTTSTFVWQRQHIFTGSELQKFEICLLPLSSPITSYDPDELMKDYRAQPLYKE